MWKENVKEWYLKQKGVKCPHCGGESLEGHTFQIDSNTATQDIDCLTCGEEWTDIYQLTDVEDRKTEV